MIFPLIALPVSPATKTPCPSTSTKLFSGMTLGSTAITLGFTRKSIPVAVCVLNPGSSVEYPVACTEIHSPAESDSVVCVSLLEAFAFFVSFVLFGFSDFSELSELFSSFGSSFVLLTLLDATLTGVSFSL